MKRKNHILMMRALENTLSTEEGREFERLLEADPEVRAQFEQLKRLGSRLQTTATDSFGPGFADRVMERIGERGVERFASLGDMLGPLFMRITPAALALTAILGVYNVTTSSVDGQSAIEAALGLPEVSVSLAWESTLTSFEEGIVENDQTTIE